MLPPVSDILLSAAPVTAIAGQRVFRRGVAAPGVAPPYVVWFVVSGVPENTLSETPSKDRMTVQVDAYAVGDKESERLAIACRDALEPHGHQTGQPFDGRSPDSTLYRISLEFDIFVDREA